MDKIVIDASRCIGCGKCVKDCVAFVLYSGFFCSCTKLNPKIKAKLKLPKGHKVVTCMIIGYPDVEYKCIAPRKPREIRKV